MNNDAFPSTQWIEIGASVLLMLFLWLARRSALHALQRSRLSAPTRRRWLNQIHIASVIVLSVGLILVWAEQLRNVTLSLVAIAAAIAIATKEVVVCLSGAFIRTASRQVSVGDRIRVKDVRGDVLETGALTTTLLEVASDSQRQTGRLIVMPNQVFTNEMVYNESHTGDYGLHLLRVPVANDGCWPAAEQRLLAAARAACADFLEGARDHLGAVGWIKGVGPDSTEPRITIELRSSDTIELLLRYPAPRSTPAAVEQAILREYLRPDGEPLHPETPAG